MQVSRNSCQRLVRLRRRPLNAPLCTQGSVWPLSGVEMEIWDSRVILCDEFTAYKPLASSSGECLTPERTTHGLPEAHRGPPCKCAGRITTA